MKRKRREFTTEFKAEVVRLCKMGERSVEQIATDLDLTRSCVSRWVRQSEANPHTLSVEKADSTPLSSNEREELVRLRKENKRLQMEREILKKATAFFAKESD